MLGNREFAREEADTVVSSTVTLLRRHNIAGTMCPRCGNDDPAAFQVTEVDDLGFITEVECAACVAPQTEVGGHNGLHGVCQFSGRKNSLLRFQDRWGAG